uniref:Tf2-1-like SH3-like domain-containing protein n=1 Tax=Tanacetum cinerariifolium TaxID=118510 RepID=A0A6L2LCL2_TANCI|nr:hypothetical protein [Tanacetum cinerariifolium]
MLKGLDKQLERKENGGLYIAKRIWVPVYGNLRTLIMNEAHATRTPETLGFTSTTRDSRMERENITMDFINKLPRTSSGHDSIWVIVDRLTKSAHLLAIREDYKIERLTRLDINEIVERHGVPVSIMSDHDKTGYSSTLCRIFIQEQLPLEHETIDKIDQIKERLKSARDRQKSYADHRRKPLEFSVGDKVLLKVSPRKGVVRFSKRIKLSPRYVGPYEIIERVSPVAYRLRLPQELIGVHDMFHVSNLKKCLAGVNLHVQLEEVMIDDKLHFVKEPMEIMDREVAVEICHRRFSSLLSSWYLHFGCCNLDNFTLIKSCMVFYLSSCVMIIDMLHLTFSPWWGMTEYISLEEEKARRHGKVYNWETVMYGKIWDNEDVYDLGSV